MPDDLGFRDDIPSTTVERWMLCFKFTSIGKSIGDPETIIEAAAKADFKDEAVVRSILKSSIYMDKLKNLRTHATATWELQRCHA